MLQRSTHSFMNRFVSQVKAVLVVEDNLDDIALLEIATQKAAGGVLYQFVRDGEQAIAYLKGEGGFGDRESHPIPELVLLDLNLPKVDGFEVLKWIRQNPKFRTMKVFVWSGVEPSDQRQQAKRA